MHILCLNTQRKETKKKLKGEREDFWDEGAKKYCCNLLDRSC